MAFKFTVYTVTFPHTALIKKSQKYICHDEITYVFVYIYHIHSLLQVKLNLVELIEQVNIGV